jgi:hypothetical protein
MIEIQKITYIIIISDLDLFIINVNFHTLNIYCVKVDRCFFLNKVSNDFKVLKVLFQSVSTNQIKNTILSNAKLSTLMLNVIFENGI